MLANFYSLTQTQVNISIVLANLALSLILGLFIIWVYRRTHRGLSYSMSFIFTMLIISLISTTVMMVVQHNIIGAFALLGAFSLIRFRTIVKDTRDVAFVFFALVSGVAVGTNNYAIALTAVPFIGIVILLATRYQVGALGGSQLNYILTFISDVTDVGGRVEDTLSGMVKNTRRLSVKSAGDLREYAYLVGVNRAQEIDQVVSALSKISGIRDVHMLSAQEAWEQ
ncbi:MAG TPA: DUF4956 domain-containing protein [Candidatus Paceibacterota bacterium]